VRLVAEVGETKDRPAGRARREQQAKRTVRCENLSILQLTNCPDTEGNILLSCQFRFTTTCARAYVFSVHSTFRYSYIMLHCCDRTCGDIGTPEALGYGATLIPVRSLARVAMICIVWG